jgi:ABC-type multidrug transport system fused ATPase/permease subunit
MFDEPTSALDSTTETAVMGEILEFLGTRPKGSGIEKRTGIFIAHRLQTIMHCDKILVLGSGGAIKEEGTHDELIEKGGEYSSLWSQQHEQPAASK